MAEYYNILQDEEELRWFFEHVIVEPTVDESYLVCISSRTKKLNEEEKKALGLHKTEMLRKEICRRFQNTWNFDIYKQTFYKYNCDRRGFIAPTGNPYFEKALICYTYVNPSSECKCIKDILSYITDIMGDLIESNIKKSNGGVDDNLSKFGKVFGKFKSCHANNVSRVIWRDFDTDIKWSDIQEKLPDMTETDINEFVRSKTNEFWGKGNAVIVRTAGGYHILIKKEVINQNPMNFVNFIKDSYISDNIQFSEFVKEMNLTQTGSQFLPTPGTIAYGERIIRVVNKEDFD